MRTRTMVTLVTAAALLPAGSVALGEPPNDGRDDAERIGRLPISLAGTVKEARSGPADGATCADTAGSVWYRVDPGRTRRVVARLRAGGDLDAVLDVYVRVRSQHRLLTCEATDARGSAAVAFTARRGQSYLVRVARRRASVPGDFRLALEPARGPRLPGPRLPEGGITGGLDRLERTAQAWSVSLVPGRRYRINVVHPGRGCVRTSVYKAGVSPRPGREPLAAIGCRGYGVFTPRASHGRRFSVLVRAAGDVRGNQRYHLQVAPAGRDDTAPGVLLPNYARLRGALDGRGVDAVDLYRFDVARRSVLFLNLRTPRAKAPIDLVLLDPFGNVLRCACDGTGSAELRKGLRPGRYFIAARARNGARAPYRLLRASRTITRTRVGGAAAVAPGQASSVAVRVTPAVSGPVTVTFDQFDPLAGWQFERTVRTRAVAGTATVAFTAPTEGRWRATARFDGTREIAPSEAEGFARILVAPPLRD